MAIRIFWELMLFSFERLEVSWASIIHLSQKLWSFQFLWSNFKRPHTSWASNIHPSQKLWPFEVVENFRVHIRVSWYIMSLNETSEWKVMTLWISWELPLFIFERLDISWASHMHPSQNIWPFKFAKSFLVQFQVSRYIMHLNHTSKSKVTIIWISRVLPLYNFMRLHTSWASIIHPSQKLWRLNLPRTFVFIFERLNILKMSLNRASEWKVITIVHFQASRYIVSVTHAPDSKFMAVWIFQELPCSIPSVLIHYVPKSYIRMKSYDHLNFSSASVVQFQASLYIMGLNHKPESKVMAIWICGEPPCSISSVSICYVLESDIQGKCYDHLNFSRAYVVHYQASWYFMGLTHAHESRVMVVWICQELSCLISSVSIYYVSELDIWIKTYDHLKVMLEKSRILDVISLNLK